MQHVRSKNKKRTPTSPAVPKTHHEIHSRPANATASRWRATKHVPCVKKPILARVHRSRVRLNRPRAAVTDSTCREVNEARRPHTCIRPCAFEEKKTGKRHEIPPRPKHTSKSSTARRPRSPRDDMQRNTSHAFAHTRPLP